jgi:hypothetical protein
LSRDYDGIYKNEIILRLINHGDFNDENIGRSCGYHGIDGDFTGLMMGVQ